MARYIKIGETTAARRRMLLPIANDTTGAAWAGSVTGVKAKLSVNGAAEVDSTNDIVRVGGFLHYVELTAGEVTRAAGDTLTARVVAAAGRAESGTAITEFGTDDVYVAAPTDASIATTSMAQLAGAGGLSAREAIADTHLGRNIAGGFNGGRTVASAHAAVRNKVTVVGGTLTVYAVDDVTVLYTAAVTYDASGSAVRSVDPA